ncbi:MAG: type II secretion system protein F [Kangiellaceae bacterium]|nr:type II secretion system protein F [Kangiellaceae bacterium]|tara:strand:- start:434 stop:1681 length:1248 start_codon:yes stop_codon:yes gene_type:complete
MATQTAKKTKKASGPKVYTYNWSGKDKTGKVIKGVVTAPDANTARLQVKKQGVVPSKVSKKAEPLFGSGQKPIKPADTAYFTRQLATMLAAGVPLVQSLGIISDGTSHKALADLIRELKNDIESGTNFSEALKRHPKYFDDLFCDLVAAGEQSGSLETMMSRIATYKEKAEAIKKKIKKALTYPIAVTIVAIVVTAILLIKVVPQFESLFSGVGADLPAFTKLVVSMSEWMQEWWFLVFFGIAGVVMAFSYAKNNSQKFSDALDVAILKAPIFGDILNKAAVARFARTLSTTFAAGVPLVDALDSAAGASGNYVYRTGILQIKEDVSSGLAMNVSMTNINLFPSMVTQMVGIGEESGAVDAMLEKVAIVYEEEVDNAVDSLSSLMEPMIMSILGTLIGGLIVAMYLPIFQMGKAF